MVFSCYSKKMAFLDDRIKQRALDAVLVINRMASVRAAYVFGSQVEGRADKYSDLDVALFIDGIENWDIRHRARAMMPSM